MVLFSLYILVSAALLVQSLHSAGRSHLYTRENPLQGYQRNAFPPQSKDSNLDLISALLEKISSKREAASNKKKLKHSPKKTCASSRSVKEPEWAQWTDWSSCSVSCGKGREIRWRHCLQNCDGVETEMEEKTCQLPACGGKLFGFINL